MENVMEYGSYDEYKRELDQEMGRAAESFVRIGYLLKVARDTEILRKSGYETVTQFAQAEYHLRPDQVTRFIQINDRFSAGGYSARLQEEYTGMGYTKLVEMLQLPDEVNTELTQGYTREDIRDIRAEIEEEKKITDIEVLLEGRAGGAEEESLVGTLMKQLLHNAPDLYLELYPLLEDSAGRNQRAARRAFAPSGEAMYSVRLRGVGKFLISLKAEKEEAAIINVRTREKNCCSWEEILDACSRRMSPDMTPKESWEKEYGEKLETEQQEKEEPKKEENPQKKEVPKKKVRNPAKEKAEKEKAKKLRAEYEKYRKGEKENEGADKNAGRELDRYGEGYDSGTEGSPDVCKGRVQDDGAGNGRGDREPTERGENTPAGEGTCETGSPDTEKTGIPAELPGGLQLPAGRAAVPDGTERPDAVQGADKAQTGQVSLSISDTGSGIGETAAAGAVDAPGMEQDGTAGRARTAEMAAGQLETAEAEAGQLEVAEADEIAPAQSRKEYLDGLTEYGAALYISQQYRNHELGWINMESVEELERWFSAMVDVLGNRI